MILYLNKTITSLEIPEKRDYNQNIYQNVTKIYFRNVKNVSNGYNQCNQKLLLHSLMVAADRNGHKTNSRDPSITFNYLDPSHAVM